MNALHNFLTLTTMARRKRSPSLSESENSGFSLSDSENSRHQQIRTRTNMVNQANLFKVEMQNQSKLYFVFSRKMRLTRCLGERDLRACKFGLLLGCDLLCY